jgi:hypothetical protein
VAGSDVESESADVRNAVAFMLSNMATMMEDEENFDGRAFGEAVSGWARGITGASEGAEDNADEADTSLPDEADSGMPEDTPSGP